jgi:hypothetical protein
MLKGSIYTITAIICITASVTVISNPGLAAITVLAGVISLFAAGMEFREHRGNAGRNGGEKREVTNG